MDHDDSGPGHSFPLVGYGPDGAGDPRFARSLLVDVAVLLASYDLPTPTPGREFRELERALRKFLYSPDRP